MIYKSERNFIRQYVKLKIKLKKIPYVMNTITNIPQWMNWFSSNENRINQCFRLVATMQQTYLHRHVELITLLLFRRGV